MKTKNTTAIITINKKAHFDYYLEDEYDAGLVLEGWEVKSLRANKVNIADAHIIIRHNEAFLLGSQIQPLPTALTYLTLDQSRTRKLLLNRHELKRLIGSVERQSYTIVPLKLFWHKQRVKIKIALAKGKKTYDKRETIKQRDWQRDKSRLYNATAL